MQDNDHFTHSAASNDAMDVEKLETHFSSHGSTSPTYEQPWSLFHSMIPDEMQLFVDP
jgi:hypothetical protein